MEALVVGLIIVIGVVLLVRNTTPAARETRRERARREAIRRVDAEDARAVERENAPATSGEATGAETTRTHLG